MVRFIDSPPLFDRPVTQRTFTFSANASVARLEFESGTKLPIDLATAVPSRQLEYLAGRYCCKEALMAMNPVSAPGDVARGADRAPIWPKGIVGAISHAAGVASVALAPVSVCRGIGVDTEIVVGPEEATEVSELIVAPEEFSMLAQRLGCHGPSFAVTLALSAKESVFKCLYPQTRRTFEFRDLSIVSVSPEKSKLTLRMDVALADVVEVGHLMDVRFATCGERVYTGCVW